MSWSMLALLRSSAIIIGKQGFQIGSSGLCIVVQPVCPSKLLPKVWFGENCDYLRWKSVLSGY